MVSTTLANMKSLLVVTLFWASMSICTGISASPRIQLEGRSSSNADALRQAAQILNVTAPDNWEALMNPATTSGTHGEANVGVSNVENVMAGWSIPERFRDQAISNVRILLLAAAEGSFTAQAFIFDVAENALLSTLLVVATKIPTPTNPDTPYAVMYMSINSNAQIKQQYSYWTERQCKRCGRCLWTRKCCCKNIPRSAPRGHSPEELHTVLEKMKEDQYAWFNQQNLTTSASLKLVKRALHSTPNTLTKMLENFLSRDTVKDEVVANYNNSVLTNIQSHFASLKLSTQVLKLNKVARQNLGLLMAELSNDYGFENFYSDPQFSQQIQSSQFSYENLFSSQGGNRFSHVMIKYIWIISQAIDNSTYAVNFLLLNTSSRVFTESLRSNQSETTTIPTTIDQTNQLNIVRVSDFTSYGEFLNESLLTLKAPWEKNTTRTVLNMFRFIAASALVPQKFQMLSKFDIEVISPTAIEDNAALNEPRTLDLKILALAKSISAIANAAKDVIDVLKSSKSVTIQRIIRFGFNYFNQRSSVLKAIDIPYNRTQEFINAIIQDYNLPSRDTFNLGITYSDDFEWDQVQFLYSPANNGTYQSLTLFKNGDSVKNTASFFIVDIDADWQLAPDLLLVTTSRSWLGGLFSSTKQTIQEVPHMLTMDEVLKLQQFFMLVAIDNMSKALKIESGISQQLK